MFRFENLPVWQKSIALANQIYSVTRGFPADELYGLTSQLRRSAVSISANIAEGSGRTSKRDFAHYVQLAYGSLMEVVSHWYIAQTQGYVSRETGDQLRKVAEELARVLSGLRTSLTRKR